jgi:hypothetical protein
MILEFPGNESDKKHSHQVIFQEETNFSLSTQLDSRNLVD